MPLRAYACGLVGYPNVGKSTLFNALAGAALAEAANYPFCTIEPNVCKVPIQDPTLAALAAKFGSKKVINAQIEFRDIAGLIKGASNGEGMGNAFLSHIRSGTRVIVQVVRCFTDSRIVSVNSKVDPIAEFKDIQEELIIADLELLSKRLKRGGVSPESIAFFTSVEAALGRGLRARSVLDGHLEGETTPTLDTTSNLLTTCASSKELLAQLITAKPLIVLANVDSVPNDYSRALTSYLEPFGIPVITLPVAAECEAAALRASGESEFAAEFLASSGITSLFPTLPLIRECRKYLGFSVFYTLGHEEARSWLYPTGSKAPVCAGVIHSDFERKFQAVNVKRVDDVLEGRAIEQSRGRDWSPGDCEEILDFKLKK